jgi:hypothetical protein
VDDERDLGELVLVLPGVVGAEQQLSSGEELDLDVGLGSATIAPIVGSEP